MLLDDFYTVDHRHLHSDGSITTHPAGRFMVSKGNLTHLEDYYGGMHVLPEGPIEDRHHTRWEGLKNNPYFDVSSRQDLLSGRRLPPNIPDAEIPEPPEKHEVESRAPAVFEYHRVGMNKPHIVELMGSKGTLDGNELHPEELETIKQNVMKGAATLRYHRGVEDKVAKMESTLSYLTLRKADELDPQESMNHLQTAVQNGHVDPKVADHIRQLIYGDRMIKGIGNKFAFSQWSKTPRPGTFLSIDGNDLKSINDTHGHAAGDAAISALGNALRESADEVTADGKKAKVFHTPEEYNVHRHGGDEFVVHMPTHEHAARFARTLRDKLDAIPPVGGSHKLSVSMGFGHDLPTSDKALYAAKAAKGAHMSANQLKPGQAPSFAHSLVPGHEGPIPFSQENPLLHPGMTEPL